MTVHNHGVFIVFPHWKTRLSAPWPQSDYPDTELTSPCPMLIMPSAWLGSDKYQFCISFVWFDQGSDSLVGILQSIKSRNGCSAHSAIPVWSGVFGGFSGLVIIIYNTKITTKITNCQTLTVMPDVYSVDCSRLQQEMPLWVEWWTFRMCHCCSFVRAECLLSNKAKRPYLMLLLSRPLCVSPVL